MGSNAVAIKAPRWLQRILAPSATAEMSFFDHLDELRSVLLSCLWGLMLLTVAGWFFSGPALDFLVRHTVGEAQFIRPMEGFTTRIKLALLMAVIAGMPFYAFQVWGFVVPGLLNREKRLVFPLVLWSTLLMLIGVGFSALALTPTMLRILMSFATEVITPMITVGYLLDFFLKMALACAILFQLPLVIAVLSFAGIVTPEFLRSKWRHAIVLILIIAAIVTPGDGPSQLVLAVPIVLLYFVSIWVSARIHRRKRAEDDRPPEGPGPGAQHEDDRPPDDPASGAAQEAAPPPDDPGPGDTREDERPQDGPSAEEAGERAQAPTEEREPVVDRKPAADPDREHESASAPRRERPAGAPESRAAPSDAAAPDGPTSEDNWSI